MVFFSSLSAARFCSSSAVYYDDEGVISRRIIGMVLKLLAAIEITMELLYWSVDSMSCTAWANKIY